VVIEKTIADALPLLLPSKRAREKDFFNLLSCRDWCATH